nr:hypothetical protein [Tanacetum cinerariifolium]
MNHKLEGDAKLSRKTSGTKPFPLSDRRKNFPRAQEDDPGPIGSYNPTSKGNHVYILRGIGRSSQCSATGGKKGKEISGTL